MIPTTTTVSVPVVEDDEKYNSNNLAQIQKHVLLRNGTFSFDTQISNMMCCCSHDTTNHLDHFSTCLVPNCLCDKFLEEGFKVSELVLTRRGTIKKKNARVLQVPEPCVEVGVQGDENELLPLPNQDKSLDSYIEGLAQI